MLEGELFGDERIAVVGLSCRVPGADDAAGYWRNLLDGTESIDVLDRAAMVAAGVSPEQLENPSYIPVKGVLRDFDCFDSALFGMSAREAVLTDPQHRIFLEQALAALEDAGYGSAQYRPSRCGVFAGCGFNTYIWRLMQSGEVDAGRASLPAMLGNASDYLATRVAHKLDCRGPALTVQTACSTALTAVHLAAQSLLSEECDIAVAGGVTIRVPQMAGHVFQNGGILSADRHCRPFDAEAAGTINGCGAGVVVLRRLEDALRDGDPVRCVILASAINNDGAEKQAFTAPNPDAQTAVIAQAMAQAGLTVDDIDYLEAHATGTELGDAVEIAAAARALVGRKRPCLVGSVKGNIGHLDAAAGSASLIKTILSVEHGLIPPSINCRVPNPACEFASTPFEINRATSPWPQTGRPRRAGVSSFGFGGTNVHVVLEQAPPVDVAPGHVAPGHLAPRHLAPGRAGPQLICLQSAAPEALDQVVARLRSFVEACPERRLEDIAYTLQVGRQPLQQRLAFVARDQRELIARLSSLRGEDSTEAVRSPAVVVMLDGEGSVGAGTVRRSYDGDALFRRRLDEVAGDVARRCQVDVRGALLGGATLRDAGELMMFVLMLTAGRVLRERIVSLRGVVGVGVGELAALVVADAMTLDDALSILQGTRRSRSPAAGCRDGASQGGTRSGGLQIREPSIPVGSAGLGRLYEVADLIESVPPCERDSDGDAHTALSTLNIGDRALLVIDVNCRMALAPRSPRVSGAAAVVWRLGDDDTVEASSLACLGELWAAGAAIDWKAVHDGRRPRRISLPSYPFQRQRHMPQTSAATAASPTIDATRQCALWSVVWRRLARRAPTKVPGRVLLAHYDDPFAQALVQRLSAVTKVAEVPATGIDGEIEVPEGAHVVYVCKADVGLDCVAPWSSVEIGNLFRLARAVSKRAARLDVVTIGAYEGTVGGVVVGPHGAAAATFAKVMRQEGFAPALGRTIDADQGAVNPDVADRAAVQVVDELLSDRDHELVCCRGNQRLTRDFEPVVTKSVDRSDGVYLLSGGRGGIGRLLVRRLASRPGARVAVLQRSAPVDGGIGLAAELGIEDDRLIVCTADVRDRVSVSEAVKEIVGRFGPITAVIHLAGVAAAGPVAQLDAERISLAIDAKLQGAINVQAAIARQNNGCVPEVTLLLSSLTGLLGGPGLAVYAAANAALEAYGAAAALRTGGRVVALSLDRVAGVGMADTVARTACRVDFDRWWWLAHEHRVMGKAIVPGTVFLGSMFGAMADRAGSTALVADEVTLLRPVELGENGPTGIVIDPKPSAPDFWTVDVLTDRQGKTGTVVARGRFRASSGGEPGRFDLAALRDRCPLPLAWRADGLELVLGERWNCLNSLRAGDGEWLAELELPPHAHEDALAGFAHPALLDVAIGAAIGVAGGRGCVPVSYRGVQVYCWPLPSRLISHIAGGEERHGRWRFAVTLADPDGRIALRVDEYCLQRVDAAVEAAPRLAPTAAVSQGMRQGLDPDDIPLIVDQALSVDGEANLFACNSNLRDLIKENADQIALLRRLADVSEPVARVLWVMRDVLGAPRMGADDDFFALGGDSILALDVVSRLNQANAQIVSLAPNDLYLHPTPRSLAQLVADSAPPTATADIMLCRLRQPIPEHRLRRVVDAVQARLAEIEPGRPFSAIDAIPAELPHGLTIQLLRATPGGAPSLMLAARTGVLDQAEWRKVLSELARELPADADDHDESLTGLDPERIALVPESQVAALERAAERVGGCRLDEVILAAAGLACAPKGWSVQAGRGATRFCPIGPALNEPQDALGMAKAAMRQSAAADNGGDVLLRPSPGYFACVRNSLLESPVDPNGDPMDWSFSGHHKMLLQWWRDPDDGGLRIEGRSSADGAATASCHEVARALQDIARHCASQRTPTYSVSDFPHIQLNQEDLDQLVVRFASSSGDLP
ncbi:SDR family NAD(P)-dependent oxidoreductase [Bradyrhizobium ontarionense]|uniref:SDR family NAD(P)-dependent oxidoreductase n=1 Tax=Bradyrhizobium ontarionense TaxID=2898149 RepID=UPI002739F76B|nr:SDR family NAD(P)-dependent oxidoreductase [Bradyrhizobium sp. A19]